MPDTANLGEPPSPMPGNGVPEPKRRKIRKGTCSCWECKRRKIRCIYPSPTDTICDGCRRRGTRCVGQELPEETSAPASSSYVVGDRLGKMEALVEQLVKKIGSPAAASPAADSSVHVSSGRAKPSSQGQEDRSTNPGFPTPDSITADSTRFAEAYNSAVTVTSTGLEEEFLNSLGSQVAYHGVGEILKPGSRPHDWGNLSRTLHAAFPSQHDVDIIVDRTKAVSFHQALWLPYSRLFDEDAEREIIELRKLPPPTAHPAVIGMRMLMLATFMQHIHPKYEPILNDLDEDLATIRARLASLAITYVASRDELVGSLEGLECILLAAIFQSNAGNLRRAWLTFRRAINLGQLMGLHRPSSPQIRRLDLATTADQRHLWFRINYGDTILSLSLGMPVGCYDVTGFVSEAAMQADTPMGRLERMHLVIAQKALQRNDHATRDADKAWEETQKLDLELQRASRSMPPRWWTVSQFGEKKSRKEVLEDNLIVLNHFYHYTLLNQLHLPFMMASSPDRKCDYSRMTCVNAARELLTRFIAFRSVNLVAFCCRSVDFSAFIASMTLLLAHLDAHRHGGPTNYLAHQRLSDRGMMEHVADTFAELYHINADSVSLQSQRVLRRLLAMELDAADGANYSTSSDAHQGASEACSDPHESENAVRFFIPYFGTIRIAKEGVTRTAGAEAVPETTAAALPPAPGANSPSMPTGGPPASGVPDPGLVDNSCGRPGSDWQTTGQLSRQQALHAHGPGTASPLLTAGAFFDDPAAQQLLTPDLTAGTEDWAFQGVDQAFFDNLMRVQHTAPGGAIASATPGTWAPW